MNADQNRTTKRWRDRMRRAELWIVLALGVTGVAFATIWNLRYAH